MRDLKLLYIALARGDLLCNRPFETSCLLMALCDLSAGYQVRLLASVRHLDKRFTSILGSQQVIA